MYLFRYINISEEEIKKVKEVKQYNERLKNDV
jgi:hypothetical protein